MPIALLTDFGAHDYFAAAMKGAILTIASNAVIVDLTHDIEPFDIASAGFNLASCFRDFPKGTIFVAVVDPGVGSDRRALFVCFDGYEFLTPDNGILSMVLNGRTDFHAYALENTKHFANSVSPSFHGRDVFAPVAAHRLNGVRPDEFGPKIDEIVLNPIRGPVLIGDGIYKCSVIHTDRFGNLVTDLTASEVGDVFEVLINGKVIDKRRKHFAEGKPGELFLIEGSTGRIEISLMNGSAHDLVGAGTGSDFILRLPAADGKI
jgi:S-adenosyl-L-methionine hydrolase (adenosine-forming)